MLGKFNRDEDLYPGKIIQSLDLTLNHTPEGHRHPDLILKIIRGGSCSLPIAELPAILSDFP